MGAPPGINPEDFHPRFKAILEIAGPSILALPTVEWNGQILYVIEGEDGVSVTLLSKEEALEWENKIGTEPGKHLIREIEEFSPEPGKILLIVISSDDEAQVAPFFVKNVIMSEGSDAVN
jgi:hypothetical protein